MGEGVWEFVEELAAYAKERVLAFVRENLIKILPLAADAKERVLAFERENLIKILPLAADAKERVLRRSYVRT
ncbi:Uncharacterized protein M6B38_223345 [Iris pallida]|uniref:Uncharacterized protein n=1 Tax=Iris pallida TaxID=29817 RepID=A0AAX6DW82_IRIPA|nr:Uncharacterized protein M6B38_223345 [Iris pallida]